jgi:peptide-methionine (R)-S-oxide reductase
MHSPRRLLLAAGVLLFLAAMLPFLRSAGTPGSHTPSRPDRLILSDAEWKARLTPEQYKVLRHGATQRPFCEEYREARTHGAGAYHCSGCDLELFVSGAKFDSGTGWPSFFQPAGPDRIDEKRDLSHGMVRTEILCARCGGHLGHVFDDGPRPTGQRYCVNAASLVFKPATSPKKD